MGVIFFLSAQSTLPDLPKEPAGLTLPPGKVAHVAVYAVLAALLVFGLAAGRKPGWRALLLAFVGATLYGVTDELHQSFVPFRTPAWTDVALDSAGAALGAAGIALLALLARWWDRGRTRGRPA